MIVDRPFLFALRHVPTGTLVLLGLVNVRARLRREQDSATLCCAAMRARL